MTLFKKYRQKRQERKLIEKYQLLAIYDMLIITNEKAELYEHCRRFNQKKNLVLKDIQELIN